MQCSNKSMLHSLSFTLKCFFPFRQLLFSLTDAKAKWQQCWRQSLANLMAMLARCTVYSRGCTVYRAAQGPSTRPLGHQAPVQASESYGMILLRTKHQGQNSWLYLDILQCINILISLYTKEHFFVKTNWNQ